MVRSVTTCWVLTEVADALSAPKNRQSALKLISSLRHNPAVEVLPPDLNLFERGLRPLCPTRRQGMEPYRLIALVDQRSGSSY